MRKILLSVLIGIILSLGLFVSYSQVKGTTPTPGTEVILRLASAATVTPEEMEQARIIIEIRAQALAGPDASAVLINDSQIIVWLPGIQESDSRISGLVDAGLLEFVDFSEVPNPGLENGTCVLTDYQVSLAEARLQPGETPLDYSGYTCGSDPATLDSNGSPFHTVMTGAGLENVQVQQGGSVGSTWMVGFDLKEGGEGVSDFVDYIGSHENMPLAIVLDGRLVSAPVINADLAATARIGGMTGGVITGRYTKDDADVLAAQLQSGALFVPLEIVSITATEVENPPTPTPEPGTQVFLQPSSTVTVSPEELEQARAIIESRAKTLAGQGASAVLGDNNQIIVQLPGIQASDNRISGLVEAGLLELVDFSEVPDPFPQPGACILTDYQVSLAEAHLQPGETLLDYSDYTCGSDPATLKSDGSPFHTIMTGAGLDGAWAVNNESAGLYQVNFTLKTGGEGVSDFLDYIGRHENEALAIVLDGRLVSAPMITSNLAATVRAGGMTGGVIAGNFTQESAVVLAAQLQSGALTIPLEIVGVATN